MCPPPPRAGEEVNVVFLASSACLKTTKIFNEVMVILTVKRLEMEDEAY